jgi:transmembrane sensor
LNQHYNISLEDLLVKYLLQEASPEERQRVDEWLTADPANQQHYDQLRLIWEKSLRLTPRGGLPDIEGEEETAWQTLKEKLHQPARQTPVRTIRWTAVAAAAAIAVLFWWRSTPTLHPEIASNDAIRTDTLADGSVVTLNKHSSMSFAADQRDVSLKGEAFFRIAPDKNHPFHVQTNGITITVLGTSFNVSTLGKKTVILVQSGLIEVKTTQSSIHVKAGESIALAQNDSILQTHTAATALYNYYQPRVFVCHDTPLGDLVDALNQAYGDSIVIGNPQLTQLPITTTFQNESLSQIIDVIKKTLKITVDTNGSRYTLK